MDRPSQASHPTDPVQTNKPANSLSTKSSVLDMVLEPPAFGALLGIFTLGSALKRAMEGRDKLVFIENELTVSRDCHSVFDALTAPSQLRLSASRQSVEIARRRNDPDDLTLLRAHARALEELESEVPYATEVETILLHKDGRTRERVSASRDSNIMGAFGEIHIARTPSGRRLACKGVKNLVEGDECPAMKRQKRVNTLLAEQACHHQ